MKKAWRYTLMAAALVAGLHQTVPAQQPPPRTPPSEGKSGPRRRQPPRVNLTPEQEQEAMAYIQKVAPDEAERLKRLKAADPKRYADMLNRRLREKRRLERLKQEDPARYENEVKIRELERQSHELADTYRNSTGETARSGIRTKLATLTARLFDLREGRRQEEVKRMERDLERLRANLTERQKHKQQIIERRVAQLLGEAGTMEW